MSSKISSVSPKMNSKRSSVTFQTSYLTPKMMHKDIVMYFDHFSGSKQMIFGPLLQKWSNSVGKKTLEKYFNTHLHSWYYGNIIHAIINVVFYPYVISNTTGNDMYKFTLSEAQIVDALSVIKTLCGKYKMNKNTVDYYGMTPYDMLTFLKDNSMISMIPEHIMKYYDIFLTVLSS